MARQVHVNLTMPAELWKELQDHVEEKKKENPVASASDIIRALVRDYLKKAERKRKK
jgi:metal-responsive CopG/Arc/MetJ family transcriptional regulator